MDRGARVDAARVPMYAGMAVHAGVPVSGMLIGIDPIGHAEAVGHAAGVLVGGLLIGAGIPIDLIDHAEQLGHAGLPVGGAPLDHPIGHAESGVVP